MNGVKIPIFILCLKSSIGKVKKQQYRIPKTESSELPLNMFSVALLGAISREFINKDFLVVAL